MLLRFHFFSHWSFRIPSDFFFFKEINELSLKFIWKYNGWNSQLSLRKMNNLEDLRYLTSWFILKLQSSSHPGIIKINKYISGIKQRLQNRPTPTWSMYFSQRSESSLIFSIYSAGTIGCPYAVKINFGPYIIPWRKSNSIWSWSKNKTLYKF